MIRATILLGVMGLLSACDAEAPSRAPPDAAPAARARSGIAAPAQGAKSPASSTRDSAHDLTATQDPSGTSAWRLPGPFAPGTTVASLRQRFGAENVRIDDVPGGEGETSRGVILFPEDAARRAYLYFRDGQHLRGLSLVRVIDAGSHWQTDHGIAIGTPLSALVAMNGRPIRFAGFDWDYGGTISDWNGGHLQPRDDDPWRWLVRLDHRPAADGAYPMGDAMFSSDDPKYPRLGQVAMVGEIGVSFPVRHD